MIVLEFIPPIPWSTRRIMRALVDRAREAIDVPHRLPVKVAPAPTVTLDNPERDGVGFGCFIWRRGAPRPRPMIGIGGRPPAEIPRRKLTQFFADTLAHELAHYEQFRDGLEVQERGVAVRARTIAQMLRPGRMRRGA